MSDEFPLRLLSGICWSFIGSAFESRHECDQRLARYQQRILKEDRWRPNQSILPVSRVAIRYRCWQGDEIIEPIIHLVNADGQPFTTTELIFQLHNAVIDSLRDLDHHFFEGLRLAGWLSDGQTPLYEMRLGS